MPVSYKKLFHLLLDRGIKKGELQEKAGITASIMARLAKDQTVKSDTIGKICRALDCQPGDIMEYVPDPEEKNLFEMLADQQRDIDEAPTTKEAVKAVGKNIKEVWRKK